MSVPNSVQMAMLEELVDQHTLREVVIALGVLCGDKAAHIQANWQDGRTARVWNTQHDKLLRWSEDIPV